MLLKDKSLTILGIIGLLLLTPDLSNATTQVVQYFSKTPVSVCQPNDSNSNCLAGSGGVTNLTANVGISSSNPGQALDVQGSTRILGNVSIGSTSTGDELVVTNNSSTKGMTINGSSAMAAITQSLSNDSYTVGNASGFIFKAGQTFTISSNVSVSSISVSFNVNSGSPTGGVTFDIETISGGLPSGVLVSAGATVSNASITPSSDNAFIFATPIALTPGTYAFTLTHNTPVLNNSYNVNAQDSDVYAGGQHVQASNGVWGTVVGDFRFAINFSAQTPQLTFDQVNSQYASITAPSINSIYLNDSSNTTKVALVSGNFGVGSTSPGQTLDVNGNIRAIGTNQYIMGSDNSVSIAASAATSGAMVFDTNSLERMRILNSNGNVGIGSASPGQLLDVSGTTRTTFFQAGSTGQTNIDANGNIGVGIASPARLLDVNGTARIQGLLVVNGASATVTSSALDVEGTLNTSYIAGNLSIGTTIANNKLTIGSNSNTDLTQVKIMNPNALGGSTLMIDRGSTARVSQIELSTSGTADWYFGNVRNIGSATTGFSFTTRGSDVGSQPPQMIILTGNTTTVGIGTVNPNTGNALGIYGNEAIGAAYSISKAGPANGLIVQGNVGIGSSTPGQALDVVGTIRIIGGSGSASTATCWCADGITLGHASALVTGTGAATCNNASGVC